MSPNIPPKVLIVDDEPSSIQIIGEILSPYCDIVVATSGNGALAVIRSGECIDLILSDIEMPQMNGYELCRRLKSEAETEEIPVIFLTAKDNVEDEVKGFKVGAVDYVTKPFNPTIVIARVNTHLKLKKYHDMLKTLSFIDGLTSVPNRRRFDEVFLTEWKQAVRDSASLSLIMIDVDFFKKYNDYYGHQAGDLCLKKIAVTLSSAIHRPRDFIARYGGEEFVCILPSMEESDVIVIAESMRQAVESCAIKHHESEVSRYVTISLGVASTTPSILDGSGDKLLRTADQALYKAKENSRNQVFCVHR